MISSVWNFINYWFFRYLLVTELYMVEKWERVMFHIVFFIIFGMISLFNSKVVVGLISLMTDSSFNQDMVPSSINSLPTSEL